MAISKRPTLTLPGDRPKAEFRAAAEQLLKTYRELPGFERNVFLYTYIDKKRGHDAAKDPKAPQRVMNMLITAAEVSGKGLSPAQVVHGLRAYLATPKDERLSPDTVVKVARAMETAPQLG